MDTYFLFPFSRKLNLEHGKVKTSARCFQNFLEESGNGFLKSENMEVTKII